MMTRKGLTRKGLTKAFRTAAKLPAMVSSGRKDLAPKHGESPIVLFKLAIVRCNDLLAKNASIDPYVVVSILNTRFHTPVVKKNANPVYPTKEATFEFPLYLSLADKLAALELVVWSKDMLKKEYLGELALPLADWFGDGQALGFDDDRNQPITLQLVSTRARTQVAGSVQIKLGFVSPPQSKTPVDFSAVFAELNKRSRPSLVSAPPTEGIGTLRTHEHGPAFEDDGGISSDDDDMTDDDDAQASKAAPAPESGIKHPQPERASTLSPKATPPAKSTSPGLIPRIFPRRSTVQVVGPTSGTSPEPGGSPRSSSPSLQQQQQQQQQRAKEKKSIWSKKKSDYNFHAGNDITGIVLLEVKGAADLPKFKNITRTGWDMDPFLVISFGKKVFRTRVIRHSLNPVWDEKMLFHVREYEKTFQIQFSVLDWDKLSSNDHIGEATLDISKLLANAPQPDPVTGLYAVEEGDHMKEFELPVTIGKEVEDKYHPVLTFRAKYQCYTAIRQRFWRHCLKQYDTGDTGHLSHLELTSMLDSLGSTLSTSTINSFFTRYGKQPADEIPIDLAIQCLETEICRPHSERRRLDMPDDASPGTSSSHTPLMQFEEPKDFGPLDFSGMTVNRPPSDPLLKPDAPAPEPAPQPLVILDPATPGSDPVPPQDLSESEGSEDAFERVINVKNCPLCHRPRMSSKGEMDIVTHLAVCASSDWAMVNRIMVGDYVTASQAQRKWYTKVIGKLSSGDYRLGANSANIIVQNRLTGQLEEEKMQVYVRLGIRLLYKGAKSRMEGARARHLLKSLSIKQGIKFDDPDSVQDIHPFIEFHKLNVEEILDPLDSFKNFNEFFYRKLKPSARPIEAPEDPYRLVSGADCRLMAFESVNEATRLWIKGREFSVARLLGDAHRNQVDRYVGGALVVFRLAPQDYHRFHSPVDGVIGPMTDISGEYYTVNPQAIRTSLDVYGENVRKVVPIDSPQFGRVMAVCVGAMMVGSIRATLNEGDPVKRGQEFGYFAFGGSTIVTLFEKGAVEWDEDLLINGRAALETLVRVGMGIGRGRRLVA